MTATPVRADAGLVADSLFARVLAGVDGSEPGLEAVRQAARLVAPEGRLELFGVVHLLEANLAGWSAERFKDELWTQAEKALEKAAAIVGSRAETRLVNGPVVQSLLQELEETKATLAMVGTHGHSRISEILLGGVAGELLHNAPCSVFIARPPADEATFPRAIVAGCDGSSHSETAVAAARQLAERFGVPLSIVTATRGKAVDRDRAWELGGVEVDAHPVDALVGAAAEADILVVGSRGLHGLDALGSVSERVAHRAGSSVLVVRRSA